MASGSPLIIFSAPTFFPLVGQPYLGLNRLPKILQEENASMTQKASVKSLRFFIVSCLDNEVIKK